MINHEINMHVEVSGPKSVLGHMRWFMDFILFIIIFIEIKMWFYVENAIFCLKIVNLRIFQWFLDMTSCLIFTYCM